MTREEAIEVFNKPAKHIGLYNGELTYSAKLVRAFEMAIEALQTDQNAYTEGYNACKRIMAREKNFNHYCPKCMGKLEPCEDAISRAEAMNAIDTLYLDGESAQGFTADANEDCLIGKYKAIEILDELPSVQPAQKWIPVSEGLPEEDGEYLVTTINGDVDIYVFHTWGAKLPKVIAWMPLPELYKTESEEA